MLALTRSAAVSHAHQGIRVNAGTSEQLSISDVESRLAHACSIFLIVAPGAMDTPLLLGASQEFRDNMLKA